MDKFINIFKKSFCYLGKEKESFNLAMLIHPSDKEFENEGIRKTWLTRVEKTDKVLFYYEKSKEELIEDKLFLSSSGNKATVEAFKFILSTYNFNYLFMPNFYSYVDLELINKYLKDKPKINYYDGIAKFDKFTYICKEGYFLSKDLVKLIVDNDDLLNLSLSEDIMIGELLAKFNIVPLNDGSIFDTGTIDNIYDNFYYYHYLAKDVSSMLEIHESKNRDRKKFLKNQLNAFKIIPSDTKDYLGTVNEYALDCKTVAVFGLFGYNGTVSKFIWSILATNTEKIISYGSVNKKFTKNTKLLCDACNVNFLIDSTKEIQNTDLLFIDSSIYNNNLLIELDNQNNVNKYIIIYYTDKQATDYDIKVFLENNENWKINKESNRLIILEKLIKEQ